MAENKKPLTAANIKYLLAIQSLCTGQSGVRCTDLARRLNVAKPSVHAMVRSLSEQGLAAKERYGTIFLTEAGQQMAAQYAQCVEDLSSRLKAALEAVPGVERDAIGANECDAHGPALHAVAMEYKHAGTGAVAFDYRADRHIGQFVSLRCGGRHADLCHQPAGERRWLCVEADLDFLGRLDHRIGGAAVRFDGVRVLLLAREAVFRRDVLGGLPRGGAAPVPRARLPADRRRDRRLVQALSAPGRGGQYVPG